MNSPSVQQHPASVDAYIRHGWSLVPIPPGTKGPRATGWNKREAALASQSDLPPGYGIGLAHAFSGTMAFDIDSWDIASQIMGQHGIDLAALYAAPDAVIVDSGRAGRGKLLYQMPAGLVLPSKKVIHQSTVIYELRCATSSMLTVQDVLPPSIHPETMQPYRWAGRGHWTRLPMLPEALLAVWESLLEQEKTASIAVSGAVDASWNEIQQAVEHINPNCSYQEWITIGMALHWAGTQTQELDYALALWNEWSQGSEGKYPGERVIYNHWVSFKPDKATSVKLGSLFHIAKEHGWARPEPDVSQLFKAVESTTPDVVHSWKPKPPKMNLDLWPEVLATRAKEVSVSVGCDPLVPLWAGLAAVCGVVDAQIRLELMPGYRVPPVLWLMTLGDPADKKSPGSRPMMTVLKDIEFEDRPRFSKEHLEWQGKEAAYASAKKAFLEFSASPEAMMSDQAPVVPELPPQPVPLKITVSDITSQKLVHQAQHRPRGLLCYLDEMNGWIRNMTMHNSGDNRSTWVVSYESERYEMDRVGTGSIHCENLAVSVYGNVQPTVFRQNVSSLASDGLLQRFLPAVLSAENTRLGDPSATTKESQQAWENLLRLAYSLPAQVYHLSFPAFMEFREFQSWYEEAKANERLLHSGDTFMTAFGKLEGTAGRLILLFHIMENPFSTYVEQSVVIKVIELIKSYLIPAYRFTFGDVGGTTSFDAWVADYIIQYCDKPTITLSEVKRSARRPLDGLSTWTADQWVYNAMYTLEVAGWVIRMDDGSNETRHQAQWAINPRLITEFKDYRKKVVLAKQKMFDDIYNKQPANRPRPIVHGNDEDL